MGTRKKRRNRNETQNIIHLGIRNTRHFASRLRTGTRDLLFAIRSAIDAGQPTLRLVADNARYSDSEIIPCIRVTMILSFFDGPLDATSRLRPMRRVTREIELDPGEAASFDISPSLACGDGGLCPQVRDGVYVGVSVFATPVEGDPIPPRLKFNSTLALREWGRTIFTLPVTEKGFDPQPDPPVLH